MTAQEKIEKQFGQGRHIAVGLDTDISKIPYHLHSYEDPVFEFNKVIIDSTADHAASYKLNFAFYEKDGSAGIDSLYKTIEYLPKDKLIIGDAKRGDIGNTSQMYAFSLYNHFGLDSATLHPYMGYDSVEPFLKYDDKINFILALTSNKGAMDFEKLRLEDGSFVFQSVIKKVSEWNSLNNCGIVFGATKKEELEDNIASFGNLYTLLPGVGAQGGSLEDVTSIFRSRGNHRFLVNVSRSLLYKDNTEKFGSAAKEEILVLNETVKRIWDK